MTKLKPPLISIRDSSDTQIGVLIDYFNDSIERFLEGKVSVLTLSALDENNNRELLNEGNSLSFTYNGEDYHLTIVKKDEDEDVITITAWSLVLELNNETKSPYEGSNMTFAQYLNAFDGERILTLNINEVSDKRISHKWDSQQTMLERLFSLATVFDAEIEFETILAEDGSLEKLQVNAYKAHSSTNQGIGKNRSAEVFYFGEDITTVKKSTDIMNLYTAIRPIGKDGLTLNGYKMEDVKDEDGETLFFLKNGMIYAPRARELYPSNLINKGDRWTVYDWDTEYDSQATLCGNALAKLRDELSTPAITWTIEGYIEANIGDTISVHDNGYNPALLLEARINSQRISMTDPSSNETTFSNIKQVESQISDDLIARMNELIQENKTYDVQILTTNGYSFKNGVGETTLTARVMDGPKDATNEFNLTWFKNSTEYSHDPSIIVRAGSIDDLATYLIIAEKDGRERGRNELTVFNVKDGSPGKTPVVHLAWADSADGSVGFTLELPTDWIPKYRGYYVDYSTVASTNPKLYKWERNPDDAGKVADEAIDKADSANNKADSAIDTANSAKDTADEASKQTAIVNELANTAKELADKANADAAEANRLIGLTNGEIDRLNTDVSTAKSDLASAEAELNSKIETVKTTLTQDYATKTNLSETQITLNKTISESVASVKQEMSEKYSTKTDLTTLQGEYNSFKEDTAQKFSQQVSSIQTIQTDTTEAQKLANDAYGKANSAVASATNASSTANSALDKASDATSVANSASQNATNAVANANAAVSTANTAKNNADKAIADVAALTQTVSSQSTKIDQTSNRIDLVASSITEVGNKLDNLQVGGRNLLKDTGSDSYNIKITKDTTSNIVRTIYLVDSFDYNNLINKTVVLSFRLKNDGNSEKFDNGNETWMDDRFGAHILLNWKNSSTGEISVSYPLVELLFQKANNKRIYSTFTFTPPNSSYDTIYSFGVAMQIGYKPAQDNDSEWFLGEFKLEIGNKATDWSPAPEDQQSQIDGINNNLSNNYYQKTTVDSKLSTAVSGITAQYTQDITTKLGNYYDKSTIDSKLTIDGQGITTYVKNTQSKLDNMTGFRNLWKHTKDYDGSKYDKWGQIFGEGKITYKNWKPYTTIDGFGVQYINHEWDDLSQRVPIKHGGTYTLSAMVKLGSSTSSVGVYINGATIQQILVNGVKQATIKNVIDNLSATEYKRVSITYKNNGNMDYSYARFEPTTNSTMYIYQPMFNEGEPLPWEPNKEDMITLSQYTEVKQLADRISSTVYDSSTGLTTKVNQLANKYAITALNSAGDILASLNLNANTSTAEINAKLIRLNGSTKMDDAFVNKLVANSILTNKIKATEISGDYIKGGTIDGTIVKSTGPNGTTKLSDGWFISTQNNAVGQYGAQSVNMTISDSSGRYAGSTKLTYNGFINEMKNKDGVFAKRKITFHAEGFKIEPEKTNVGTNLNSGMHLVGRKAYLDFVANTTYRDDTTPYHLRIIANEDGKSFIESTQGRLEIYTKNQEQLVVNANYIPQTAMDNNMGVKRIVVAKPNESGTYMEVQNRAGKAWGVSVWASDQRLKDNITAPTKDALDTLNQLQVRQFDWKSDNVHEDFGLIAQEVEQVLPNAVFKVGDYYQVKDSGLIPVLIGAVQRLSNKVNILENIIYNTKGGNLL